MYSRNMNKTGLTFSLSDMNIDPIGVDLVPISLESDVKEEFDKSETNDLNFSMSNNLSLTSEDKNEDDDVNLNNMPLVSDAITNPQLSFSGDMNTNLQLNNNITTVPDIHTIPKTLLESDVNQDINIHWFYCVIINGLAEWKPFSIKDSLNIEKKFIELSKFNSDDYLPEFNDCVAVDGGRYDVLLLKRQKVAVFWEEPPMEIRRASWFYRPEDAYSYLPYSEQECEILEKKFLEVVQQNLWNQSFELHKKPEGCLEDRFVFHSSNTIVQYRRYLDVTSQSEEVLKGRVVCRGVKLIKNHFEEGESDSIDHVIFVIHGIGPVYDIHGCGIVECVTKMRNVSKQMLRDHFSKHDGRIEILPVSWYDILHKRDTSIDKDLSKITLKSVPRLRTFTNGTLVDVLCYTSPKYAQTVLSSVAAEMNRLRHLFVSRNPTYEGTFSLAGHSLGSVIAFDLLVLQSNSNNNITTVPDIHTIPKLEFDLGYLFGLGSPISLMLISRGVSYLGVDFRLPVKGFFNIFHPFDPVAYRIEPMILDHVAAGPVVVPHHKGRKRLHLELKDNIMRVGSDIKSKLMQTLKMTWSSLQEFASSHKNESNVESWENGDIMKTLSRMDNNIGERDDIILNKSEMEINMGQINNGRRVDYVLQEAPLESFNDYLFALGSHACYWESEDTVLLILKEIYSSMNVVAHPKVESSLTSNVPLSLPLVNNNQLFKVQSVPLIRTFEVQGKDKVTLPPTFASKTPVTFFQPSTSKILPKQEASMVNDSQSTDEDLSKLNRNISPVTIKTLDPKNQDLSIQLPPSNLKFKPSYDIYKTSYIDNSPNPSLNSSQIENVTNDKNLELNESMSGVNKQFEDLSLQNVNNEGQYKNTVDYALSDVNLNNSSQCLDSTENSDKNYDNFFEISLKSPTRNLSSVELNQADLNRCVPLQNSEKTNDNLKDENSTTPLNKLNMPPPMSHIPLQPFTTSVNRYTVDKSLINTVTNESSNIDSYVTSFNKNYTDYNLANALIPAIKPSDKEGEGVHSTVPLQLQRLTENSVSNKNGKIDNMLNKDSTLLNNNDKISNAPPVNYFKPNIVPEASENESKPQLMNLFNNFKPCVNIETNLVDCDSQVTSQMSIPSSFGNFKSNDILEASINNSQSLPPPPPQMSIPNSLKFFKPNSGTETSGSDNQLSFQNSQNYVKPNYPETNLNNIMATNKETQLPPPPSLMSIPKSLKFFKPNSGNETLGSDNQPSFQNSQNYVKPNYPETNLNNIMAANKETQLPPPPPSMSIPTSMNFFKPSGGTEASESVSYLEIKSNKTQLPPPPPQIFTQNSSNYFKPSNETDTLDNSQMLPSQISSNYFKPNQLETSFNDLMTSSSDNQSSLIDYSKLRNRSEDSINDTKPTFSQMPILTNRTDTVDSFDQLPPPQGLLNYFQPVTSETNSSNFVMSGNDGPPLQNSYSNSLNYYESYSGSEINSDNLIISNNHQQFPQVAPLNYSKSSDEFKSSSNEASTIAPSSLRSYFTPIDNAELTKPDNLLLDSFLMENQNTKISTVKDTCDTSKVAIQNNASSIATISSCTSSPKLQGHSLVDSTRRSPKVGHSTLFASKPLVPQSGKIFPRR